jgi:O-antigen ligase
MIALAAAYLVLLIKKKLKFSDKKFMLFSGFLLLGVLLSLINSINTFRTISVFAFSLLTLSYSYIFTLLIKNRKILEKSLLILIISGILVSVLGFWQFYRFNSNESSALPFETSFDAKTIVAEAFTFSVGERSYLRPSSTFIDVNLTAGFLSIVIMTNLALLIRELNFRKNSKLVIFYLISFLINLSAFFLTVSRSGYLGLFVGGILFLLLNIKYFLNKKIIVGSLIGIFLLILSVIFLDTPIESMWGRFQTTFQKQDPTGSTQEHLLFSEAASNIFKQNPIVGIGSGNFEEYYLNYVDTNEDTAYTYNIYLSFLSETGIVGFLTQISFMIFILICGFKAFLKNKENELSILSSALICGYISILIANLFYSYYILFFVWLVVGLILASLKVKNE